MEKASCSIRAQILRLQYARNAAPRRQQLYYTIKIAALIRQEGRV